MIDIYNRSLHNISTPIYIVSLQTLTHRLSRGRKPGKREAQDWALSVHDHCRGTHEETPRYLHTSNTQGDTRHTQYAHVNVLVRRSQQVLTRVNKHTRLLHAQYTKELARVDGGKLKTPSILSGLHVPAHRCLGVCVTPAMPAGARATNWSCKKGRALQQQPPKVVFSAATTSLTKHKRWKILCASRRDSTGLQRRLQKWEGRPSAAKRDLFPTTVDQ